MQSRARRAGSGGDDGFSFDAPPPRQPQSSTTRTTRPRRRRSQDEVRREKRAKFKNIMAPRVNKAIHDIGLLVHGANRKRYYYTQQDKELIRDALHEAVEKALAPYVVIEKPEGIKFED